MDDPVVRFVLALLVIAALARLAKRAAREAKIPGLVTALAFTAAIH